jgi:hypothetical protein
MRAVIVDSHPTGAPANLERFAYQHATREHAQEEGCGIRRLVKIRDQMIFLLPRPLWRGENGSATPA